jgi:monofunctional biosynthetic peptidoglycan transglycosylase
MKIKRTVKRICLTLAALFVVVEGYYIGQVVWYSIAPIQTSAYIESERERLGKVQFKPVLLRNISNDMVRATVAAEDARFMDHFGIEWEATGEAFVNNVIEGERAPGGSTITQQTVKNLFLTHEKSYLRKFQEMVLALVMDATWSKGRILQTYLNVAEFGEGIFGVEAAARHYYGISARRLSHWQSVWLAAILSNPRYYERQGSTDWLRHRIDVIEGSMKEPQFAAINNRMH